MLDLVLPLPGAFSTAVAALLQSQAAREGRPSRVAMLCAAAVELQRAAYEVVGTLDQRRCKRESCSGGTRDVISILAPSRGPEGIDSLGPQDASPYPL